MSFSGSCSGCGLLWEIGRWLRTAQSEDDSQSLAEYLDAHGYSERFRRHFLVPHTDPRLLPRTRAARASWNYRLTGGREWLVSLDRFAKRSP